jgi:hypothetical protein
VEAIVEYLLLPDALGQTDTQGGAELDFVAHINLAEGGQRFGRLVWADAEATVSQVTAEADHIGAQGSMQRQVFGE